MAPNQAQPDDFTKDGVARWGAALRYSRRTLNSLKQFAVRWLDRLKTDIVLISTGALFLGLGLHWWSLERPIPGGVVTAGKIVAQVTETDSNGVDFIHPVIEFTDRYERTHRFQWQIAGSEFDVGQTVKVRYDPDDPSHAQWADQPGQGFSLAVAGGGAVLWIAELGVVARRLVRRRATRPDEAEPVAFGR